MAIACLVDRAPIFPSRISSSVSLINSPAWVVGAFPWRLACSARFIVDFIGMVRLLRKVLTGSPNAAASPVDGGRRRLVVANPLHAWGSESRTFRSGSLTALHRTLKAHFVPGAGIQRDCGMSPEKRFRARPSRAAGDQGGRSQDGRGRNLRYEQSGSRLSLEERCAIICSRRELRSAGTNSAVAVPGADSVNAHAACQGKDSGRRSEPPMRSECHNSSTRW